MVDTILDIARDHYQQALREHEAAALPDAGWRWHSYCILARQMIKSYETREEAIHSVQAPGSIGGYEARFAGAPLARHVETMEQNCQKIFPHFADKLSTFAETPLSFPSTITFLNGRLVSSPLYNHIIHTMRCLTFRPRARRILEIGGGYGAPGRAWITNGIAPAHLYVTVDFPETLFFAEVYLRATIPEIPIRHLSAEELPNPLHATPEIWLCPISALARLRNTDFDIVINTGSLQEMSSEYVDFYMEEINHLRSEAFYSANYFCQRIDDLKESMNFAAPVLGQEWVAEFMGHSNEYERGTAEAFYRRDRRVARPNQEQFAAIGEIDSPLSFLNLFELLRRTDDPQVIMEWVSKAISQLPSVPKEALYLVNRARKLSGDLGVKDAALHRLLSIMAEKGREKMGIVDPSVAELRQKLMHGKASEIDVFGTVESTQEGPAIKIDNVYHVTCERFAGQLESGGVQGSAYQITGWAADQMANAPVRKLIATAGERVIAAAEPTIIRPDIAGGIASGAARAGFALTLADAATIEAPIRVYAIMADGTAARLGSALAANTHGRVEDYASPPAGPYAHP